MVTVTKDDDNGDKELSVPPLKTQIAAQLSRDEGDGDPIKRIVAVRCLPTTRGNTCVRCG